MGWIRRMGVMSGFTSHGAHLFPKPELDYALLISVTFVVELGDYYFNKQKLLFR